MQGNDKHSIMASIEQPEFFGGTCIVEILTNSRMLLFFNVLKTGLYRPVEPVKPDARILVGTNHAGKLRERQRSCTAGKFG
ncbi:hypothetical protein Hdeb2414_s0005g00187741 [Helianthus debilis subsp. tardiflorus]